MSEQWIEWPHDECPACGASIQIKTSMRQSREELHDDEQDIGDPPYCYSGDAWRCEDGHSGTVYCDTETPVQIELPFMAEADDEACVDDGPPAPAATPTAGNGDSQGKHPHPASRRERAKRWSRGTS